MKREGKLWYILIVTLGIVLVAALIASHLIFDFYSYAERREIYYNEGFWAFFHSEIQSIASMLALFSR